MRQGKPLHHRILVIFVWLLIWQVAAWLVNRSLLLAAPLDVVRALSKLAITGSFWQSVGASLLRIQAGFLLGLAAGTGIAFLTARFYWMERLLAPAIRAIRATPVASFIILALVWLSTDQVVVFIVLLMVLPIIWTGTGAGLAAVPWQLMELARSYRLDRRRVRRIIILPALKPHWLAAATTALGLGWKAGIAAEVLSRPTHALGSRLYEAKIYLETPDLMACTAVVILISLALEAVLDRITMRARLAPGHVPVADQTDGRS